jgi:hypothetical protein
MTHRNALIAFGAVAFAAAGFAAGALTAIVRDWGSPIVSVTVQNNTVGDVRLVALNVTSCGTTSKLSASALAPGQAHTFRFSVCGEGGYELEAILPEGKMLKEEAYVESGYSVNTHIEQSRIRSHTEFYRL